jgi:hypothetical protein
MRARAAWAAIILMLIIEPSLGREIILLSKRNKADMGFLLSIRWGARWRIIQNEKLMADARSMNIPNKRVRIFDYGHNKNSFFSFENVLENFRRKGNTCASANTAWSNSSKSLHFWDFDGWNICDSFTISHIQDAPSNDSFHSRGGSSSAIFPCHSKSIAKYCECSMVDININREVGIKHDCALSIDVQDDLSFSRFPKPISAYLQIAWLPKVQL